MLCASCTLRIWATDFLISYREMLVHLPVFVVASAKKKTTSGAGEREKLKIQEAPPLL